MVIFSMRIVTPAEKHSVIFRSLCALLGPTRVEPGCHHAFLCVDYENSNALMLIEEWESQEDFDRQFEADKLKVLVAAIELSREAPAVRILTVSGEQHISSTRETVDALAGGR